MVHKGDNDVMAIGRPKHFSRAEVMEKSIPVFWEHGFADTSLASLGHYIETSGLTDILATKPLGWTNVEKYLKFGLACWSGQKGCFSVSSMRELAILPQEARHIVEKSMKPIRRLLISNIEAEKTTMDASGLADLAMTLFSGLSIEQNLATNRQSGLKRIEVFMQVMRAL